MDLYSAINAEMLRGQFRLETEAKPGFAVRATRVSEIFQTRVGYMLPTPLLLVIDYVL